MSENKAAPTDSLDLEAQAQIMKDIKNNMESLKVSIDQILDDMTGIRRARLEILEKVDSVKTENAITSAQIQATLGKAKKIMKKSDENQTKLEHVLRKINDFNVIYTLTNVDDNIENVVKSSKIDKKEKNSKNKNALFNINSSQERIRLQLLDNNKYLMTSIEPSNDNSEEVKKEKSDFKWGKDSPLKELQWILKMKLYKIRHHYDRLPFDQELEERMVLPVSWGRAAGQRT